MEVKGVTLKHQVAAFFPDVPTTMGTRNLLELAQAGRLINPDFAEGPRL